MLFKLDSPIGIDPDDHVSDRLSNFAESVRHSCRYDHDITFPNWAAILDIAAVSYTHLTLPTKA